MSVRIRFQAGDREIGQVAVAAGTLLLDAVRQAGLPVARACGASGLCGRCGLEIRDGAATLPSESEAELRAKRRNRVSPELRLACRVTVASDLVVSAPYW